MSWVVVDSPKSSSRNAEDLATTALSLEAEREISSSEPLLGVSFAYFERFIFDNGGREAFEGKTTAEVNATVLVPLCQKGHGSICQQLRRKESLFVGPPTWFVSHAWSSRFLDVIEAVEITLRRKEGDDKYRDAIIWFDQFTLYHTGSNALDIPYETLHDTFMNSTRAIGKMILVFDRWDDPKHLTRAWCVFEAYAAVSTESQLEVGMSEAEHSRFLTDIAADEKGELFYKMLAKIKSESSQATVATDKALIHQCIVEKVTGGFTGLDRAIFRKMEEWMIHLLENEISTSESSVSEATWRYGLADVLSKSGRLKDAEAHIESCVSIRTRELGKEHTDTLNALNNLAELRRSQGRYNEAEPLYQECLDARRRVLGTDHPSTLTSINNLAGLYWFQGRYDEAEPLYVDCFATRRRLLGDEHPDTLVSMNLLALLYKSQERFGEAEPLFQDCLVVKRRVLGSEHPSTLMTLWNLAAMYASQKNYSMAEASYSECLAGFRRVFSETHPHTQQCEKMLQQVLEEIKK